MVFTSVGAWAGGIPVFARPVLLAALCCVSGCGDQMRMPAPEQLAAFEKAASVEAEVDMDRVRRAKLSTGPYRAVPGDVLEFIMPSLLQAVTATEVQAVQSQNRRDDQPFIVRVDTGGAIALPAVGRLQVAGLSLAEIEEEVVEAYRRYVVLQPSVYARVLEYSTSKVYIAGAVEEPGVYTLRADQMTLVSLLTEAGGISDTGAAVVRVVRAEDRGLPGDALTGGPEQAEDGQSPAMALPVVGMNVPFSDIALEEGDTVIVEQIQMPLFSVLGLVNKPGNFEYPPGAEYNLAQAIAFAGGLDVVAEPRYVTIYRLTPDGSIIRVPFKLIDERAFTEVLTTPIRAGDVVAVEDTPRTRLNTMLHNMLRFNTGVYITGHDLWDRD